MTFHVVERKVFYMRTTSEKRNITIMESTPEAFSRAVNFALQGIDDPTVEYPAGYAPMFVAHITYAVSNRVPEDALERMEQRHGMAHCKECPMLSISTDKRKRKHMCTLHGRMKHEDQPACLDYYMQKERGDMFEPERMEKGSKESAN